MEKDSYISEYAMLQPKPSHYIVRGSKLPRRDGTGRECSTRPLSMTSRDQVREVLDMQIPIGVAVILDE